MAMGISYDDFWKLNPRKIKVVMEAYKLRRKIKDEEMWLFGNYTFAAVQTAIGNAFRKKGQKPKSYFEVMEEPNLSHSEKDKNGLTEYEKKQKTELLFKNLEIMAANFNLTHKAKG